MSFLIWRRVENEWIVFAKTRSDEQVAAIVEAMPVGTAFMIGLGPIITIRGVVA